MNEDFAFGTSFLHRLDPRGKIISAIALTLIIALTDHYTVAGGGLLVGFIFFTASQIGYSAAAKRLAAVNTFTLFLWLTLPLTYGGPSSLAIGPLAFSDSGIRLAALITIKTNSIFLIIISLLTTSTIGAIGHGLTQLRLPTKLCYLLLYSYRYIFVIHQEYTRLYRAAKMRNFSPTSSLHTYRTFGYLFGMTVIQSWNRSKRVNQAMILRGFSGRLIPLEQLQFGKKDSLFVALSCIIFFCLMTIGYLWPLHY